MLSDGLVLSGLSTTNLNVSDSTVHTITITPAANVPLNSLLLANITAHFNGTSHLISIPVQVNVPGADAIAAAAVAANRLGNTDLANRLNDLSVALTNLVQTPASELFKTQALAALDALIGLLRVDAYTAPQVPALQADRTALSNAVTTDQIQSAVFALGVHLRNVATTLADAAKYNFTLAFVDSSQTGVPLQPTTYEVVLQNTGTQAATYDLSVIPVGGGASATISPSSITLQPGQVSPGSLGVPTILVTVTSNFSFQITPLTFQVNATARNTAFGEINKTIVGQFIPRPEVIQVVSVAATPPFTSAGASSTSVPTCSTRSISSNRPTLRIRLPIRKGTSSSRRRSQFR